MRLAPIDTLLTTIVIILAWTGNSKAAAIFDEEVPFVSGAEMHCGTYFIRDGDEFANPITVTNCWDPSMTHSQIAEEIKGRWQDLYKEFYSCKKCTAGAECAKYAFFTFDPPVFTANGEPGCWSVEIHGAAIQAGCEGC